MKKDTWITVTVALIGGAIMGTVFMILRASQACGFGCSDEEKAVLITGGLQLGLSLVVVALLVAIALAVMPED